MSASEYIKDVGEIDFEYEVLMYSKSLPVLAYFWADWCKPCKTLQPFLERLAEQANGGFRLAKVDADANPNLAIRYEVRTLPTIKAFADGEVSGSLIGPQPEGRVANFVQNIAPPSQFILDIEKANSLLERKLWEKAENEFRKVLDDETENSSAMLGLIRSLIPQGKVREALNLLDIFPASREYNSANLIRPLVEELVFFESEMNAGEDDMLPAYQNCLYLARKGNFPAAIDGLLDILRSSKTYRHGKARQVVLAIMEVMGNEEPLTREYRAELASILF